MTKKKSIKFVELEEPKFITDFKARSGIKGDYKLEDKFVVDVVNNNQPILDDERPQIVLGENSEISVKEANDFVALQEEEKKKVDDETDKKSLKVEDKTEEKKKVDEKTDKKAKIDEKKKTAGAKANQKAKMIFHVTSSYKRKSAATEPKTDAKVIKSDKSLLSFDEECFDD